MAVLVPRRLVFGTRTHKVEFLHGILCYIRISLFFFRTGRASVKPTCSANSKLCCVNTNNEVCLTSSIYGSFIPLLCLLRPGKISEDTPAKNGVRGPSYFQFPTMVTLTAPLLLIGELGSMSNFKRLFLLSVICYIY